jgi:hypothetical protein
MSFLKNLFGKKESSCCNVKIEEVKEEVKSKPNDGQKKSCCI